jgi:hypothetical protein
MHRVTEFKQGVGETRKFVSLLYESCKHGNRYCQVVQ